MTLRRTIPVVCAVITNAAGEVLLAQRPPEKHLGGKWEFAGGKVEPGEPPATALVREIHEELGCVVDVLRALPEFEHDYGDVVIHMNPFVCRIADGSPLPIAHEHVALQWATESGVRSSDLAPADWPVVDSYFGRTKGG